MAENSNSFPEDLMVEIKVENGANCDVDTQPVLDQVAALINGDATQVAEKALEKEDDKVAAVENPTSEVHFRGLICMFYWRRRRRMTN